MPKSISDSARQRVIEIAEQQGFVVQLKANGEDQYVKNLMFYSRPLNQTVYIRKDRSVGAGGEPEFFQVAVHPYFFNKNWVSVAEGIEELINRQKQKNLHSSSNYKNFPIFPENDEPCGMCFKVANYDSLAKLFLRMSGAECHETVVNPVIVPEMNAVSSENSVVREESPAEYRAGESIGKIPTKGLIIKSPYIEKILSGAKTWEMRSSATQVRGPIALIKKGSGQVVGVANLVDVKGPLSLQDRLETIDKHHISPEQLETGETEKWHTAWVLENARPLITPVHYQHPNGAVIWVNLDRQVQEKLALVMP